MRWLYRHNFVFGQRLSTTAFGCLYHGQLKTFFHIITISKATTLGVADLWLTKLQNEFIILSISWLRNGICLRGLLAIQYEQTETIRWVEKAVAKKIWIRDLSRHRNFVSWQKHSEDKRIDSFETFIFYVPFFPFYYLTIANWYCSMKTS